MEEEKPEPRKPALRFSEIPEHLPLPESLKTLHTFQGAIDHTMNMLMVRQQSLTFTSIKEMVERSTMRTFTLDSFRKVLAIAPFFYNHDWELKLGKMELMVSLPSNILDIVDKLSQGEDAPQISMSPFETQISSRLQIMRASIFKKLLVQKVYQAYRDMGFEENHNLLAYQAWPIDMDLEKDVPNVEGAKIKEQPKQVAKVSVNQFIETIDTKTKVQQFVEDAKTEIQKDIVQAQPEKTEMQDDFCDTSSEERAKAKRYESGVSQATLHAIEMKNQLVQEAKQSNAELLEKQEAQKNIDAMFKLVQMIQNQFISQLGHRMFMNKIITNLMESRNRGMFVGRGK